MKTTLTIGEAMGLFIAEDFGSLENVKTFSRYSAGAEMNVAIGLSRLGFNSYYSTLLGKDYIGAYIEKFLKKENVNTDLLYFNDKYNTGIMLKEKVLEGDPLVDSYRKNSACTYYDLNLAKNIDVSKFDLFHGTGIFLALSSSTKEVAINLKDRFLRNNSIITFDPNLRVGLWSSKEEMIKTINEFAKNCDYVLPGISEGKILTGSDVPEEIADFYINIGVKNVIIKLGEKGAYYKNNDGKEGYVEGYKVEKVIDTVGAGDGFATGVVSGILDNCHIIEICKRGCGIGAIQVTNKSDNEGLPTREELFKFMEA